MPPFRFLSLIAAPKDLAAVPAAALADSLRAAFEAARSAATDTWTDIRPATEVALRQTLAALPEPADLLHLVLHAEARPAANYMTLQFEASDGRHRSVNARTLLPLVTGPQAPRGILLQAATPESQQALVATAEQWAQGGCPWLILLPASDPTTTRSFTTRLLHALFAGQSPEQAVASLRETVGPASPLFSGLTVHGRQSARPLVLRAAPAMNSEPSRIAPPIASPQPSLNESPVAADPLAARLKSKRAAGAFDVFLCHNSADKPAVRRLGLDLKARGFLPWLDEWEFPPGRPWQPHLESVLKNIQSAAVCFGGSGIGPWQEEELYGFLREFKRRGCPVIPVLLPEAPLRPDLPLFLQAMTWVDFRLTDPDPMTRLIWGITGQHPDA